jgi:hypothetical protein
MIVGVSSKVPRPAAGPIIVTSGSGFEVGGGVNIVVASPKDPRLTGGPIIVTSGSEFEVGGGVNIVAASPKPVVAGDIAVRQATQNSSASNVGPPHPGQAFELASGKLFIVEAQILTCSSP